jgi:uncharacterized membrane protein YphA (DoxX/SURF4 family)
VNDLKRVSLLAILFLVLLRIAIGWQFLYEGLWKYDTLDTAQPWSSEGYLRNAQGPLRDHFRAMTGDPDDLNWLKYDSMSRKWDDWRDRFVSHYGLNDDQQKKLAVMLDGPELHSAEVGQVPEPAAAVLKSYSKVVTFDAEKGRLTVKADEPLLPSEAAALKASVPVMKVPTGQYARTGDDGQPSLDPNGEPVAADPADQKFYQAIERLSDLSGRLSFRRRLRASLAGDPDRVGVMAQLKPPDRYEPVMGMDAAGPAGDESAGRERQVLRYGEIQQYKDELAAYESALKLSQQTHLDYHAQHAERLGQKVQALRSRLVGPVRALETDLKREALKLLDQDQLARGPIPPVQTQLWQVDQLTIWGLTGLGVLLIIGFWTRLAALAGAALLVLFYLPFPPWPGVPQPPGPEHSFVINKNLIEALALLGIAALPTGSWFGLDGVFRWLFRRRTARGSRAS